MQLELNSLEITKIIAQFNKRNIKLTLDNPTDINLAFNDVFPIFVQAYGRVHKAHHNSKCHEINCSKMKSSGVVILYQYANMVSLADKNHFDNIQTVHNLLSYFSYFKKLPVVDMNGMFGIDLSTDENYLNGYYYTVVPYSLCNFLPEQRSRLLKDVKLNPIWHDYILSYASKNQQIYLSYLGFNDKKILAKIGYSALIADFIDADKLEYKKFENLIDFLKNEKTLYDEEYEECGLQFSSSFSTSFEQKHFGLELTPCPFENKKERSQYLDFLGEYFSKLEEYELITHNQKDFVLNHEETIRNKDGVLKFRWANPDTYEIKWYNIERRNGGLTGG